MMTLRASDLHRVAVIVQAVAVHFPAKTTATLSFCFAFLFIFTPLCKAIKPGDGIGSRYLVVVRVSPLPPPVFLAG